MKTNHLKPLLALGCAMALAVNVRADFDITFDTATQSTEWSGGAWSAGPSGWAGAGCIQATGTGGGWQGSGSLTINFSYGSGHQPNLWTIDPTVGHVSFDIVVNGTSFNSNGQWWQIWGSGNSNPSGWTQLQFLDAYENGGDTSLKVYHVDKTFADLGWTAATAAAFSYYQLNLWANSDNANPINFYIDNVSVYTAVSIHPTNSISKVAGPRGLTLVTSSNVFNYDVGQEQYQRQCVRVANNGYNWVGSPSPVTYSLTITNYADNAHPGFQSQIWLIDGATTATAADYNSTHAIVLSIQNNADGTASGNFAYKVNQANGNAMFYGSGNLGSVTSSTVLGTWSMTFTGDDNVVVTAPDGSILSTNLAAGDGANFVDPLTVYVNALSAQVANIGQRGVYSKFQIVSNSTTLFNDTFSTGVIDPTEWSTSSAEDPSNVYQVPTTAAYAVSWTVPDGGFSLQTTADLIGSWYDPGLPKAMINGRRTSFLSSAYASTNSTALFRLLKP
jgi:hypothetical protein